MQDGLYSFTCDQRREEALDASMDAMLRLADELEGCNRDDRYEVTNVRHEGPPTGYRAPDASVEEAGLPPDEGMP